MQKLLFIMLQAENFAQKFRESTTVVKDLAATSYDIINMILGVVGAVGIVMVFTSGEGNERNKKIGNWLTILFFAGVGMWLLKGLFFK